MAETFGSSPFYWGAIHWLASSDQDKRAGRNATGAVCGWLPLRIIGELDAANGEVRDDRYLADEEIAFEMELAALGCGEGVGLDELFPSRVRLADQDGALTRQAIVHRELDL